MKINFFELAKLQLQIEDKEKITEDLIIDYAIKIRRWFDKHKTAGKKILAGKTFYQQGNRIKFY